MFMMVMMMNSVEWQQLAVADSDSEY